MNNVVLIGRLTRDPELRHLDGGSIVGNFTLAVDKGLNKEKRAEFEAAGKPTADFINITVWGKLAENCATYLKKGRQTAVNGRIETSTYDAEDGTKRYSTSVVANNVEFIDWGDRENNNQTTSNNSVASEFTATDDIPF